MEAYFQNQQINKEQDPGIYLRLFTELMLLAEHRAQTSRKSPIIKEHVHIRSILVRVLPWGPRHQCCHPLLSIGDIQRWMTDNLPSMSHSLEEGGKDINRKSKAMNPEAQKRTSQCLLKTNQDLPSLKQKWRERVRGLKFCFLHFSFWEISHVGSQSN